jgi:predicted nucleic acid-binding protein
MTETPTGVFLDACVLVPITLTNVLLTAAESDLIRPYWSHTVVEEAVAAIREISPDRPEAQVRRRFAAMDVAFSDSLVEGDPAAVADLRLPDSDDLHVVAAAVAANADLIVTDNTADFPAKALGAVGLRATTPGELLSSMLSSSPEAMLNIMRQAVATLTRPPITLDEILATLERCWAADFVAELRTLL